MLGKLIFFWKIKYLSPFHALLKVFYMLFAYFGPCWLFVAVRGATVGCVHRLLTVELPLWSAALGPPASGLQPVFSKVVAHGASCSVAFEIFPDQIKPASPALAGRFSPTVPPVPSRFTSLKMVHPVWGWSIVPHCQCPYSIWVVEAALSPRCYVSPVSICRSKNYSGYVLSGTEKK